MSDQGYIIIIIIIIIKIKKENLRVVIVKNYINKNTSRAKVIKKI